MNLVPKRSGAAAALAALCAAALIPAVTVAQDSAGRTITVREKVKAAEFIHHGSARGERLAMGDRVITRQALFDTGDRPIGTLVTDCVNTGATVQVFKATLQCVSTYRFEDGQVVSAGVARLADGPANRFPIVGGAGAYRGASGQIEAGAPVEGYQGVDVLHLDS
jgi:hypothetical protein